MLLLNWSMMRRVTVWLPEKRKDIRVLRTKTKEELSMRSGDRDGERNGPLAVNFLWGMCEEL